MPSGEAWSRASNTVTRIQFLSIFPLCLFKFFPFWVLSFPPHHIIHPAPAYTFNPSTVGDPEEVLREGSALNFEGRICIGLTIGLCTFQQRISFLKAWQSKATGKFEELQIVWCCWRTEFIWRDPSELCWVVREPMTLPWTELRRWHFILKVIGNDSKLGVQW